MSTAPRQPAGWYAETGPTADDLVHRREQLEAERDRELLAAGEPGYCEPDARACDRPGSQFCGCDLARGGNGAIR